MEKIYGKDFVAEYLNIIFIKGQGSHRTLEMYTPNQIFLFAQLSEKQVELYLPYVKISLGSAILVNKYLPIDLAEKTMRSFAGRKHIPKLYLEFININKKAIDRLPPVMRLKVFESFLENGCRVIVQGAETYEDFVALFFCTSLKYNDRVNRVVSKLGPPKPEPKNIQTNKKIL